MGPIGVFTVYRLEWAREVGSLDTIYGKYVYIDNDTYDVYLYIENL